MMYMRLKGFHRYQAARSVCTVHIVVARSLQTNVQQQLLVHCVMTGAFCNRKSLMLLLVQHCRCIALPGGGGRLSKPLQQQSVPGNAQFTELRIFLAIHSLAYAQFVPYLRSGTRA